MGRLTSVLLASVSAVACLALAGCSAQTGSPSASATQPPLPKAEAVAGAAGKTAATLAPTTSTPAATKAQAGASAVKGRVTAQEAWRLVDPEVQKWEKGAKIALGGPSTASKDFDLFDGRASELRFTCVSPDGQQFWAFYVNTSGEQPRFRSGQSSRPAVTAMTDPSTWQVDSPKAYEIAVANGLKDWLATHPAFSGKDGTLELRGLAEIGSYWLLICHEGKDTMEFQISATDGKVHLARSH